MGKLAKTIDVSRPSNKIDGIKQWLKENYVIKLNTFDHDKSYIDATADNPIKYEYSITENDIFLHMIDDGVNCSKSLLKALLSSPNQIESYNPISEYLDRLKGEYRGLSQIEIICKKIKAHEFGKSENECQERFEYIFKKWLVACIACIKGVKPNDVSLGLVNAQGGIGKTTFFENLVPGELKEYYTISSKDEKLFKMTESFTKKFIINFDEFVGISKSTENEFKNNMSRSTLDIKMSGDIFTQRVNRIANSVFTSNKTHGQGGFIFTNDNGLLRRLATVEIDAMDLFTTKIDVDQLWAEALMMYEGGFDFRWNQKDFHDFTEYNKRYIIETNAFRLIKEHYRQPEPNEESMFMMPIQIFRDMRDKKLIKSGWTKVDEVTIGQALTLQGFNRHMKRIDNIPRYGYDVIPLFQ